ncbi:MAG TPA: hypothetical protein VEC56_02215 [Candidatus Krumholzibacteria bacterium]|nr:hypothetical protein [Candidatus Krumholzibacteria bacterium]
MRTLAIGASAGLILIGAYSLVYACNESKANRDTAAKAAKAPKAATWYAVEASATTPKVDHVIGHPVGVCKTVEAPIAIEVDVPGEAFQMTRVIHIRGAAVKHPEAPATPVDAVKRTAKVAATLGRAFVTTVGAVWGSLFDVAVQATAALV